MTRIASVVFLLLAVSVVSLAAGEPGQAAITWQGFADTRAGLTGSDSSLELSQIEVSLSALVTPWLSLDATLAGDGSDGIGLGAGYMTLKYASDTVSASLVAGRFDIPLGLSSSWYASPDNALPFSVMLNDAMVEGWNNAGCMGELGFGAFSVLLYLVEGGMESITNSDSGRAGGVRFGWKPVDGISAGVSLAASRHDAGRRFSWVGCDLEAELGPLALAFEYLAKLPDDVWERRSKGGMAQARMDLDALAGLRLGLIVRGEIVAPRDEEVERALTLGLTWSHDEKLRLTAAAKLPKTGDTGLVLQAITSF